MTNKLVFDLDLRISRAIQNVVGALVLGPPKLLGLPPNIWSGQVITEGATNELDAMRTNFVANRVRRNCINTLFILSTFLWIGAGLIVSGSAPGSFKQVGQFIINVLPDSVQVAGRKAGILPKQRYAIVHAEKTIAWARKECPGGDAKCIQSRLNEALEIARREWPKDPSLAASLDEFVAALQGVK